MSWFDEQIRERKKREDEHFAEAADDIRSILTGKRTAGEYESESARQRLAARTIGEILNHYHIKAGEVPDSVRGIQAQLEYLCRPHGIMYRRVVLEGAWYRDAVGAFLGEKKDGTVVALLPGRLSGYRYYDAAAGRWIRLNAKTADGLKKKAICFYRPFPQKRMSVASLMRYALTAVPASAYLITLALALAAALTGMLAPAIAYTVFDTVIPSGSSRVLLALFVFALCAGVSRVLLEMTRSLMDGRISTQMETSVRAAAMARILSLPAEFFRRMSAGELAAKVQHFNSLCAMLYDRFAVTGLTALLSLVYVLQVLAYAPALAAPVLAVTAATVAAAVAVSMLGMNARRRAMEAGGRTKGMTYALISGIQKIKLAGAEKRAFTRWMKVYAEEIRHTYGGAWPMVLAPTVFLGISLAGGAAIYALAVRAGLTPAQYFAFSAAYGMISGAFSSLTPMAIRAANIRPAIEQIRPILEAEPEISGERKIVSRLKGGVELSHVTFRYGESMPPVIDDLSLKIRPGQYVAIVGRTGCGKSTLLRLLLGFEKPQKGAVYYDRQDIETLDLKSLRSRIGVVMQDDKLFLEDIFSNIAISAPWIGMDEAWEAAEVAGIADDIRAMPMGMHTVITEGSGGISGGQRQRLMIARAIAPKPGILMLDEATSALDNISQKRIAEALDDLKCTRIVIAHRLSTIRSCDRILVLEDGRIAEDGTYDELMEKGGSFAQLVRRQQIGG